MNDFLSSLENLPFSRWVVESPSVWAQPTILTVHTIGMMVLAGLIGAISLRLLGLSRSMPVKPLERLYPIIWWAFGVNALTGTILMMADATSKLRNPDFYIKLVFIAIGLVVLVQMRKRVFGDPNLDKVPLNGTAKGLALASLACWIGAITAGRLLAYVGPVSGVPGLSNR